MTQFDTAVTKILSETAKPFKNLPDIYAPVNTSDAFSRKMRVCYDKIFSYILGVSSEDKPVEFLEVIRLMRVSGLYPKYINRFTYRYLYYISYFLEDHTNCSSRLKENLQRVHSLLDKVRNGANPEDVELTTDVLDI